jgi:hypothetical protein
MAGLLNGNFHRPDDLLPGRVAERSALIPELPEAARHDPQLAAMASPWLDAYIAFSKLWSPRAHDDFHESVGLWLLSTVAARRVAVDFGGQRYTSLYIALASRTSIFAKSTTAKIAQEALKSANLSFLLAADDATPQAFVRGMTYRLPENWGDLPTEYQEQRKREIVFSGQKGWYFDEFGQKVNAMMRDGGFMAEFRGLLRKFDETPDVYRYETIGRGADTISAPYLALLANITPADLQPFAKKGAALWNDGFWARFAFLTPPGSAVRKNGRFPRGERLIPYGTVRPLMEWHARLGMGVASIHEEVSEKGIRYAVRVTPMPPTVMAMTDDIYDAYYTYSDSLLDIVAKSNLTDLDGNYSRLPEKALRVAMLLASLENHNRIELRHWHRGQKVAEDWRRNLHNLYEQLTSTTETPKIVAMEDRIMGFIAERGPSTLRELYQGIRGLDSAQAKILTRSMAETGLLAIMKNGKADRYRLEVESEHSAASVDALSTLAYQEHEV